MRAASLWALIRRDARRTRGALATSGFGIAAGTAALIFFLALGLGVRAVLLGEVFPIDQVELEPPRAQDPGLLGLLVGGGDGPGIEPAQIQALAAAPGVTGVFPKLRIAFPSSARGGKEILGRDVGTSELIGDGIDPALVRDDLPDPAAFADPLSRPGAPCDADAACAAPQYCERAGSGAEGAPGGARPGAPEVKGRCGDPVPALVSQYLIEIFDKSLAPAHGLPPVGRTLVERAQGIVFDMRLGESLLGKARAGAPRTVRVRVVGVSRRAIDLGLTFPLDVVRRWNAELAGERAAARYSSAIVRVGSGADTSAVIAAAAAMRLEPRDTRARDVSVLITGVMALLSLVSAVILLVSASNIAYTFRVLVTERRVEIALYRAVGATAADMRAWMRGLALTVGVAGGAAGLLAARLLALAVDWAAARRLPDFPFKPATFVQVPWWLGVGGLLFAALFAAVGAWGPARRAARTEPAAALAGS
ncbi:MAG: ABC transporter permease [Polyangiaceae bacterium]|nr:ABC transporter permease [Polyangiaceae bacterium]